MLVSYLDLRQFAIGSKDGIGGFASDFYFDDLTWRIRYLVTEAGFLFAKHQGLVNARHLGTPDVQRRELPVALTREQLDEAESPEDHPTVSAQKAREIRRHHFDHWPPVVLGIPGAIYTPDIAERQLFGDPVSDPADDKQDKTKNDPHLRSMAEVSGYAIAAKDGDIGSVIDFLVDPSDWHIEYLVVDTGHWLPGRQVAMVTNWISRVSWAEHSIVVNVTKDEIQQAPEISEIADLKRIEMDIAFTPYGIYPSMMI